MASNRYLWIRVANADIAASARSHHWDRLMPVPFLCECDGDDCQGHVRLTLGEYAWLEARCLYVTSPGHVIADGSPVGEVGTHAVYAVQPPVAALAG